MFFFFQAEDGIRDLIVTGVQTCALPILLAKAAARGIAVEVNADPHRLDLDWHMVRRARELGVTRSVGADPPSTSGMAHVAAGPGVAPQSVVQPPPGLTTTHAPPVSPSRR